MVSIQQNFRDIVSSYEYLNSTESFLVHYEDIKDDIYDFLELKDKIQRDLANPLVSGPFVIELRKILFKIQMTVLSHSANEYISALMDIYQEFYPEEFLNIRDYFDTFDFLNIQNDKNVLIKGDIQSGKTMTMILSIVFYLIIGKDVVLVTRNKNVDVNQFTQRFNEFISRLKTEKNFEHDSLQICSKFRSAKNIPKNNCLFVSKFYKTDIKRITAILQRRNISNAIMYIDEADSRDPEELEDRTFFNLMNYVKLNIFVSATVQDILVSNWNIKKAKIIELYRSKSYKGIYDVDFITDFDFTEPQDELYEKIFDAINNDEDFSLINPGKPKITLLTVGRTEQHLGELCDKLVSGEIQSFIDVCVIKFMGYDKGGVTIWHSSFDDQDSLKDLHIRTKIGCKILLKKHMDIKSTFKWMANHGGLERFPNIVIVAGDMASRGINFACYPENWHVTHQIIKKSESTSCANIQQSLRILGNHNDDILLKVYLSKDDLDKIEKSYTLTNQIIKHLKTKDGDGYVESDESEESEESVNLLLKKVPIKRGAIPHKFLARKKTKDCFEVVSNYEYGIGNAPNHIGSFVTNEEEYDEKSRQQIHRTLEEGKEHHITNFLSIVDPERTYRRSEMLNLLEEAGYEQPDNMLVSFLHKGNYARQYLESTKEGIRIKRSLVSAWNY